MTKPEYGLATPEQVANMSGREMMEALLSGQLPQPPIAKTLSFWLVEIGDGFAAFEGEPSAEYLNPMGTVHGGWALTLIDSATGCAAHTTLPAGAYTVSISGPAPNGDPLAARFDVTVK